MKKKDKTKPKKSYVQISKCFWTSSLTIFHNFSKSVSNGNKPQKRENFWEHSFDKFKGKNATFLTNQLIFHQTQLHLIKASGRGCGNFSYKRFLIMTILLKSIFFHFIFRSFQIFFIFCYHDDDDCSDSTGCERNSRDGPSKQTNKKNE